MEQIQYQHLTPEHFAGVVDLGNGVHGDNYLSLDSLASMQKLGVSNGINASWVALTGTTVIGFRLTFAAGNWQPDQWCSPQLWQCDPQKVCYFKCNTVDPSFQAKGIGSTLLSHSIEDAKRQGSLAGLAHIWLASPGNSAFKYFSKCGGKVIKEHPNKWRALSIHEGYDCPVCDEVCECTGAEMLLRFDV